ncbi:MAG TPA: SusD/RagB family nutrient-binding outer membrane lipoprotein [Bacteroidales bacterium]|nr:SusD/RagB family nutrient-binding outer membrane lipoprotein [Bacteroidales bacterium]HNR41086.1 SusD/RagB family nutrient-binding outer membrane lipoprotein [Bacteroidales bacterium]HPM18194.1 SusD/RagB family nutrient-binding outer membrane lipoprotein [Bacteroidales bacterium]HQG78341.1 SusD/RagB family nutrient-binding outer membrane lipoprotein [Bacteroidales bacterium]
MKRSVKSFVCPVLITLLVLLTACDKRLEEINRDPLGLDDLSDEYFFNTGLRMAFGDYFWLRSFQMRFASQYSHVYVTSTEMRNADSYEDFHSQDVYKEMFQAAYTGPAVYMNKVVSMTAGGKHENNVRNAIARIVSAVIFATITDCYGDVPYSEGAKGMDGILYPKYDSQEFIYSDMMEQLKTAIEVLKTADPSRGYVNADPVYDNDLSKWVRFANSLRLRLAMRSRFASPAKSAAIITECFANSFIETNDQNFAWKHQDSENSELYNPWFDVHRNEDFRMSEKFVDWLSSTNDPRLEILVSPVPGRGYVGIPNGLSSLQVGNYPWANYSKPSPALYARDLPQTLLCASEVWFLRAEAALFGLAPGDPNEFYREGIIRNLEFWNADPAETNTFLTDEPEATLSGTIENMFRQISTQMWIAFVPNFVEAWSNIRRTGFPVIPQRTNAEIFSLGVTNGILPKRFKYATNEYLTNGINLQAAIDRQGPDKIDTPVWWDVLDR